MTENNTIGNYINQLKEENEKILVAKENKIKVIKNFLNPIYENINLLNQLWEIEEKAIIKKFNELATLNNFTYTRAHKDELNLDRIMERIVTKLSIYNYDGQPICENLPNENDEWEFIFKIKGQYVDLEVIPTNYCDRYPVDPDNNPYQFNYNLPLEVHENSLIFENKENVLKEYLGKVVSDEFYFVEDKIEERMRVEKQIANIDFSNLAIIQALKQKIN